MELFWAIIVCCCGIQYNISHHGYYFQVCGIVVVAVVIVLAGLGVNPTKL